MFRGVVVTNSFSIEQRLFITHRCTVLGTELKATLKANRVYKFFCISHNLFVFDFHGLQPVLYGFSFADVQSIFECMQTEQRTLKATRTNRDAEQFVDILFCKSSGIMHGHAM